jgi:ribonuclease P/MRP protein subunit POP1
LNNTVSHSEFPEKNKGGKSKKKGKEKEVAKTVPPVAKQDVMSRRTVWVRVHPSAWDEVWSTLQDAASLALKDFQEEQHATQGSNGTADENHIPEESVEMIDLRSQLNCFELTGPKSSQVLRGVFKPINAEDRPELNEVGIP